MRAVVLAMVLWGCAEEPPAVQTDVGAPCMRDGELAVVFETCGSSCATIHEMTCTSALEDGVLTVTTTFSWSMEGDICTADCAWREADCGMPLIEDPGTVTVELGGTSVGLDALPACDALPM